MRVTHIAHPVVTTGNLRNLRRFTMKSNGKNKPNVSIATTVSKDDDFQIRLIQVDAERKLYASTGVNMIVTRGSIIRDLIRKGLQVTQDSNCQ